MLTRPFLLIVGAAAGVILATFQWLRSPRPQPAPPAFVPDPNNDKRITVRGWRRQEIESILGDFAEMYGEVLVATTTGAAPATTLLSFPRDISSQEFFFLVNYLTYPKGHDPRDSLAVVGAVTLTDAFDLPDAALNGKRAFVYVPEGDEDYDLVHVEVVSAGVYSVSFTDMRWRPAASQRQPPWLHEF